MTTVEEQIRRAVLEKNAKDGTALCAEQERIVGEFARHFPSMAAAMRIVGEHIIEQQPSEVGNCCAEGV